MVPAAQTCCGQPGWNAGDRAAARSLAEKVIAEFEGCEHVVVPSGSCAGMIRVHYPEVFAGDAQWTERVARLAARTQELTFFLANVLKVEVAPASMTGPVTYHDSCSGLRELGIKAEPRALLARAGIAVTEMQSAEVCCGFGGTFAVKFGEVSSAMAEKKCRHIQATGAQAVVLGDLGCMLNIEGRLRADGDERTQVLHIAEVLAGPDR